MENLEWKRPKDVKTFRTSDPSEMLGKYLPRSIVKKWTEDFIDEDNGEVVQKERSQVLVTNGKITSEKLQEIEFLLASKEIKDVEVSEQKVLDMTLYTPNSLRLFTVCLHHNAEESIFLVCAQTIRHAIQIAAEYGQMYCEVSGWVGATKVKAECLSIIADNDKCIPDSEQLAPYSRKSYFKVTVREAWIDEGKEKKHDTHFIVNADDVGQAKNRVSVFVENKQEEIRKNGGFVNDEATITIRKAAPYKVDFIVPEPFSNLFWEEPTQ